MAAAIRGRCACTVCARVCATIDQIFCVLDIYGWFLESYVVDFFQDGLWDKLPTSWKMSLEQTSPEEFGAFVAGDISCKRVWPLSLLALRRVASILQINRDHKDPEIFQCCDTFFQSKCDEKLTNKISVYRNIRSKYNNLFTKHVKKKKRYEIEKIAKICANCAEKSICRCVVDIGAGMGHLARVLAFEYGLYVTCIEQDPSLSSRAKVCDEQLLMSLRKHLPEFDGQSPKHIPYKLEASSHMDTTLVNYITEQFKDNFNLDGDLEFGLVGLHPCGDLAATLLKFYSQRPEAKFICIVGCCYMKLTLEECNSDTPKGYPLSEYLLSKNHALSYTALEVACHAIEKYCDKLKTGSYNDLIVHAYRAALETILIRKSTHLRRTQLKNVKVTNNMTFEQYCLTATDNLEQHLKPTYCDIYDQRISNYLNQWQHVVMFSALRTLLAPLIETIVLLDRYLFLSERKLHPILTPVFDARLSPRNLVLISVKENNK